MYPAVRGVGGRAFLARASPVFLRAVSPAFRRRAAPSPRLPPCCPIPRPPAVLPHPPAFHRAAPSPRLPSCCPLSPPPPTSRRALLLLLRPRLRARPCPQCLPHLSLPLLVRCLLPLLLPRSLLPSPLPLPLPLLLRRSFRRLLRRRPLRRRRCRRRRCRRLRQRVLVDQEAQLDDLQVARVAEALPPRGRRHGFLAECCIYSC